MKRENEVVSVQTTVGSSGLVVHQLDVPAGDGELTFPWHAVNIVETQVVGAANWHGLKIPKTTLPSGGVTFLPAGSVVEGWCEHAYSATTIMLPAGALEAVAPGFDPDCLRYELVFNPVTAGLARSLAAAVTSDEYRAWPLLLESMSTSLAAALVAQLSPEAARQSEGLDQARRRRVLEYIEDNLSRQITLEELAGVALMSKFHFARQFKRATGKTPLQFISGRRLDEAKKLLSTSTQPIAEVAVACGFASQSHMATVFKAMVGVAPGAYRRGS